MSIADLDAIDRANERAYDMQQFLLHHPEYRVQRVAMPTQHLFDGAPYVPHDRTDIAATFERTRVERHLGTFDTAQEASAAYIAAKRQLHEGCTL